MGGALLEVCGSSQQGRLTEESDFAGVLELCCSSRDVPAFLVHVMVSAGVSEKRMNNIRFGAATFMCVNVLFRR